MTRPALVAHRGWNSRYPENTLPALTAALELRAAWLEVDVQLSRDGRPFLFHDRELLRCTGEEGQFADLGAAEIAALDAGCAERFGAEFAGTRVPALDELVALLERRAETRVLVEIKSACRRHHGLDAVLAAILPALAPLGDRALPISFDAEIVAALDGRERGWILRDLGDETLARAEALGAGLLVVDRKRVSRGASLPAGPWRWMVYAENDPGEARDWIARGASLIETDRIGELLADARCGLWGRG